jgi:hypothetical protein
MPRLPINVTNLERESFLTECVRTILSKYRVIICLLYVYTAQLQLGYTVPRSHRTRA